MLLAFDTAGPHCAVALVRAEGGVLRLLASRGEPMAKGQAERLFPMLETVLAEAGTAWPDLQAIACGVGPGNFTGVRVGVSAARGLALSLGVPAFGITAFEMMRAEADGGRHALLSLPAPKGRAMVQAFDGARASGEARLIDPDAPPRDLQAMSDMIVIGHEADRIARHLKARASRPAFDPLTLNDEEGVPAGYPAWRIASIAMERLLRGETPGRPTPLYVRAPDAAPPKAMPPPVLP